MCFVEFEDLQEEGCYSIVNSTDILLESSTLVLVNESEMTPYLCQSTCKSSTDAYDYYIVQEGKCSCSTTAIHTVNDWETSTCNTTCSGDPSQTCGGADSVLIGRTNRALEGLTLVSKILYIEICLYSETSLTHCSIKPIHQQNQCKRACDESSDCYAIWFNDTAGTCELRSSSIYDDCTELGLDTDTTSAIYVDHLEHYYEVRSA